jgi:hypothetical protein
MVINLIKCTYIDKRLQGIGAKAEQRLPHEPGFRLLSILDHDLAVKQGLDQFLLLLGFQIVDPADNVPEPFRVAPDEPYQVLVVGLGPLQGGQPLFHIADLGLKGPYLIPDPLHLLCEKGPVESRFLQHGEEVLPGRGLTPQSSPQLGQLVGQVRHLPVVFLLVKHPLDLCEGG